MTRFMITTSALSTWLAAWAEVHHPALDAVAQPVLIQQAGGDVLVRGRQLDADRARRPGLQQLDLLAPIAASYSKAPSVPSTPCAFRKSTIRARRPIKAAAAILTRFGAGRPLAETHR